MGKITIKILFVDPKFNDWLMQLKIREVLSRHYNIQYSKNPDFLFYSCFGNRYKAYDNCVKIFYTGENVSPNFNDCDYAIGYDYIDFEDRYLRYNPEYSHINYCVNLRKKVDNSLAKRKFCNFIYSKVDGGEAAVLRYDFCKKLSNYKRVDCPGKVLNNMKGAIEPRSGNWSQGKLDFIKNYKFTIAFENTGSKGYVTEKIMHAFMTNSIPIYYGDLEILRMFNRKAFVNFRDFNSIDEAIERIKVLDNNDELYMQMLEEPIITDLSQLEYDKKLEKFLLNIIEKGNKPFFHAKNFLPKERYLIKLFKY
jgi:alpha(1,3/1,4) fucosyltransferase